jgi:hypothetical protein
MNALAKGLALSVGMSLVAACASSGPPPNDQWTAAQAEVGRAQGGTAMQVPEAKLHLQLAIEDLQKSRSLIGQDDARATTLATLARTEAQLADSLAKASAAQNEAMRVEGDLQNTGHPAIPPTGATNAMPPAPINPSPAILPSGTTK